MNLSKIREEKSLFIAFIAIAIFLPLEHTLAHSTIGSIVGFVVIFAVVIYLAMNVAHHAEELAYKYGEPYGTLILTISAVVVEIIIIIIMMINSQNPELARDTVYSAIMLDINGLLGIAAIIGGVKHGEQEYNIDSTNSYVSMILVSVGIAMVLPHFIPESFFKSFEIFTIIAFIFLYIVFTRIQVKEHKYFFEYRVENKITHSKAHSPQEDKATIDGLYHSIILIVSIVFIGLLSELLAIFMDSNLKASSLPIVLGAFVVAVISASPELITAIRSAMKDKIQTVVNIALGASLATVLLTIPSVLIVSKIIGFEINLSLTNLQTLMIGLTLLAAMIHFNDGKTNALEGFLHLVLFVTFFFLMFI